ncbi:E3 ubiquitin-protein ligase TRIM33-like [Lytechinus variegatus]|uniref:E3 ubiquitin-protein ligase TRIM33-like n=1 Tax=Lytechinus variegatus TaxID=7654 RepID=UPI001BB2B9B0|nr:E3 ubiquitin-protein ligase TRIM33-like [Lytechinus variegatus]
MQKMASSKQLLDHLECPICHDLLCNPKLLPCAHSFCERCLKELHSFLQADSGLTCPVCHQDANVPGNDVSNFPTNLIVKSLVEDFKRRSDAKAERIKGSGATAIQTCTVCDGDDQDIATYYCQNCSEFLCEDCLQHHNRYKRNACHETVKVRDIEAGVVKKKFTCPEHPQELQQFVCTTCLVRICCRCREVEHKEDGHEVNEMTGYEEIQQKTIDCLLLKIEQISVDIQNNLSFVHEKLRKVKNIVSQRRQKIVSTYDTAEEQLRRRRDELLEECNTCDKTLCQELEDIIGSHYGIQETLTNKATLVNEGLTSLHQPDLSLSKYATQVEGLEIILEEAIPLLLSKSSHIAHRADSLTFRPVSPIGSLVDMFQREKLFFEDEQHDSGGGWRLDVIPKGGGTNCSNQTDKLKASCVTMAMNEQSKDASDESLPGSKKAPLRSFIAHLPTKGKRKTRIRDQQLH